MMVKLGYNLLCAVVLLMTSCAPVMADDSFILHVGGWSKHWGFDTSNITNENHKVLAGEYRGYLAGYFENSYGNDSFMVLKTWRWNITENIHTSVGVGANYGYTTCYGENNSSKNICPDAVAGVGYKVGRVSLGIKVKPGVAIFTPEIHF
ncbi:MAG: hypothetical protein Tp1111DCM1126091_4 [Prokaryotic dsDNA virus sp.]|nr:MAG: hypothetical protein Tp1111DCM1126091_4 [Prokaryotic dsDNA virus sp.]|tara:strand:- start:11535 stop:11984 length:450 start_codon:yes stop_codon:yes gene_type:complete